MGLKGKLIEMAKMTKAMVDKGLRESVFDMLMCDKNPFAELFLKINDRQYGIIMVDANGERRYVRIGAIVAELREDMTADELMASECEAYNAKIAEKAEKEKVKQAKIAKDRAKREAEKAKKEAEAKDE